ncbi:hypothetical protein Tco_1489769, partial [Tanacetum coccineum]
ELTIEEMGYIVSTTLREKKETIYSKKSRREKEQTINKSSTKEYHVKGLKRQKEAKTIKNRQGTKETRTRMKKQSEITAGSARHSQTQSKIEIKEVKSQITSQRAIIDKYSKIQGLIGRVKDQGLNLPKSKSCFIKKEKKKGRHQTSNLFTLQKGRAITRTISVNSQYF